MINSIEKFVHLTPQQFASLINKDIPFIIKQADFGPCLQRWSASYFCKKLHDNQVIIHVSKDPLLNFLNKNFQYTVYNFAEFLQRCLDEKDHQYYYLRHIGNDKRGKEIVNLKKHFPTIADDVIYPDFLNFCSNNLCQTEDCLKKHVFSSVLRISSKDLSIWTHYDVLDNILLQVKGKKRVILFKPNDAPFLYLKGDKSKIINLDAEDIYEQYPLFKKATKFECILEEGEALFIPSMWFHNIKALEFSIGINFFWKNIELLPYYDKTDVYGNKDLLPACDAYRNIDKALQHLSKLPEKYKQFYINMIISKLNNQL